MATEIGMNILENNGNAIDAAIAVSYAIGVVEPYSSGIGGGGVMLVSPPNEAPIMINYREISSFDEERLSSDVGIPGFVKGLEHIHQKMGTISIEELLRPSIELATYGFPIGEILAKQLKNATHLNREQLKHFFSNNLPLREGDHLIQLELAETLKDISSGGAETFYCGKLAEQLSEASGLLLNDLKKYRVEEKGALTGEFCGYEIHSAPLPAGGCTLIQILQMVEMALEHEVKLTSETDLVDLLCKIVNICNYEGMSLLGDPNHVHLDENYLVSSSYCKQLLERTLDKSFNNNVSNKNADYNNTTHIVIMDKNNMMVSVTNSISGVFGSGTYVKGFFLNNQLRNFSSDQKSPNAKVPGKRPFSLVAPSILKKNKTLLGIGSAGGQRIPIILSYILINYINNKLSIEESIKLPRFYVNSNKITLEIGNEDIKGDLENRGYIVELLEDSFFFGGVNSLIYDDNLGQLIGAADSRRNGHCMISSLSN